MAIPPPTDTHLPFSPSRTQNHEFTISGWSPKCPGQLSGSSGTSRGSSAGRCMKAAQTGTPNVTLPWLPVVPWAGAWQAGPARGRSRWKRYRPVAARRGVASGPLQPAENPARSCGAARLPVTPVEQSQCQIGSY